MEHSSDESLAPHMWMFSLKLVLVLSSKSSTNAIFSGAAFCVRLGFCLQLCGITKNNLSSPVDDKDNDGYEDEVPEKTILEGVGSVDPLAGFEVEVAGVDSGPSILTEDDENYEGEVPEKTILEAESEGEVDSFDSFAENGSEADEVNSGPRIWGDSKENEYEAEFVTGPFRSWAGSISPITANVHLLCNDAGFHITLLTGRLSEAKVLGAKDFVSVGEAEESCGFDVNLLENTLTVPFSGCNVKQHDDGYSLQLLHFDSFDRLQVSTISCEGSTKLDHDLYPRGGRSHTCYVPPATYSEPAPPPKAHNCVVAMAERLTCGYSEISRYECEKIGCCFCPSKSSCFYPLDECTADQHFVFAIRHDSASIHVDPTKLVIPGNADCKPVYVTDKVAIFKFKVTECGTRVYNVGEVKIYLAEVQIIVHALNLKFGLITRSNPLRFLIECRYSKTGAAQPSLATVGYMVKTPPSNLPSAIISNGLYGVQLRIATDETYQKFFPTYHQPLRLLLGKPVYLELRLKSPKPDAVILVNYCLAYPRSAKNALVLIYEGCANPHDPSVSILQISGKTRYKRRFVVTAFQFMEQKTNQYLDEEIYFMCSAEVCRPTEKECEERCFDGKTT
ncbi:zona pellucida sperm-binding protein 4-like isoform X2 [Acanthochromis polyacanthus]|uniref:zona pellucida sperm-binding protein 4-like isoform X2 n=1 Tax=Acanthochromis polyacanthus TaxID=80966 RepID=UPI002234992F|nr:zona pellucida sperm-binding protein 4-like isoform X2 [Acanthochromis polyacanthus]